MSKPESITIDDVKYVRADAVPDAKKFEGPIKIVVADKGFVFVARVEQTKDKVTLHNAKNIRRYGTTKGIGQLVNGPTASTLLDDFGTVTLHPDKVVFILDVEQAKWKL